ncbi:FMN-binding protein [Desulfobacula sp.]|uniref:FMN-binding protein n=1 Tax=Desulfobacula sp. TaxID=2593537 RepID=UPI0026161C19|nr:FMN-binding protein [Desulfobacula sp.]
MSRLRNSNLFQAWLVLVLATVFGTALAGIQSKLGPIIENNKIKETMERIPSLVLGEDQAEKTMRQKDFLAIEPRVIEIKKNGRTKFYTVYDALFKDGSMAGHVAKASGQGYADNIEVLLGLDAGAETITGLFILDQKETPGLGNRILEKPWRDQFLNKSSNKRLVVVKGKAGKAYEIDAISGATISSRAVTGIVNKTIADVKAQLIASRKSGTPKSKNGNIKETK